MAARRKLAPIALAVGGLAAVTVAIAIWIGIRSKPTAAPRTIVPIAKQGEQVVAPIGEPATTPVTAPVTTPGDAGAAVAEQSPPKPVKPQITKTHELHAASPAPADAMTPPVQPPVVAPKKKPCAKDDAECIYGDGT